MLQCLSSLMSELSPMFLAGTLGFGDVGAFHYSYSLVVSARRQRYIVLAPAPQAPAPAPPASTTSATSTSASTTGCRHTRSNQVLLQDARPYVYLREKNIYIYIYVYKYIKIYIERLVYSFESSCKYQDHL